MIIVTGILTVFLFLLCLSRGLLPNAFRLLRWTRDRKAHLVLSILLTVTVVTHAALSGFQPGTGLVLLIVMAADILFGCYMALRPAARRFVKVHAFGGFAAGLALLVHIVYQLVVMRFI